MSVLNDIPRPLQMHDSRFDGLEGLPGRHPGRCGLLFLILSCVHRREHPHLYGNTGGGGGASPGPGCGWPGAEDGEPALSKDWQQRVVRVFEAVFAQLPHLLPCESPQQQPGAGGRAGGEAGPAGPSAGSRLQVLLLQTDGSDSGDSTLHTCCRCVMCMMGSRPMLHARKRSAL